MEVDRTRSQLCCWTRIPSPPWSRCLKTQTTSSWLHLRCVLVAPDALTHLLSVLASAAQGGARKQPRCTSLSVPGLAGQGSRRHDWRTAPQGPGCQGSCDFCFAMHRICSYPSLPHAALYRLHREHALILSFSAQTFLAGRQAPSPRVLCFTVRRGKGGEKGFRPQLHIVKPMDDHSYKVRTDSVQRACLREL